MNQPISRSAHGVADYSYASLVPVAPKLLGFSEERTASNLCYLLGSGALLYSLFTRAEWGVVRKMPFKTHIALDIAANLFAIGAPWLLGFHKNNRARNTVLAVGLTGLTISLFTKPEEMKEL
ncbi:SPW repeat domain-containing protein [Adhaeribacter aquaticus]|uniref:SPW repeat domain-containing protein n=1 Tax=Adhaeribacter aquaticus TaxID=299567 RepID=UPI0003F91CD7|nr:hypothetical protein [Adhaeribacter aquaticus]